MVNPILQMLNPKQNPLGQTINNIASLKQMMGGNPQKMFNDMLQNNPKFKQFVDMNKGKSVDQIARENGIDMNTINQLLK